jgi:hypothetical protein
MSPFLPGSNVTPPDLLVLLQEAASKYASGGPPAQTIALSYGITAKLVVHGNVVTSFYPVAGPGVVRATDLLRAVP